MSFVHINGRPTIVMEYFPQAKDLISSNVETKTKAYLQILDFLNSLDPKIFFRRSPAYFQLLSLPYVLLLNIISYPAHISLFLKASLNILLCSPDWIGLKSDHVCHGDINVANIMALKNKVVLLDFSRCFVSHKFYNLAQALNSSWFEKNFAQKLASLIVPKSDFKHRQILNSFVIYNLLQRLTAKYPKPDQEQFYLQRLKSLL
mgnify:FL=1